MTRNRIDYCEYCHAENLELCRRIRGANIGKPVGDDHAVRPGKLRPVRHPGKPSR